MTNADWVDRTLFPFRSRWLDLEDGLMHYVDEGAGPVVLLVHGTPTWSFLYRHAVTGLARDHRVIAADHLGFGLSGKPPDAAYRPLDHARRLMQFIERLALRDIVLVVHDFGGPIGLSYALEQSRNVRGVALFNTWLWSLRGTPTERIGRLMGSGLGRFLYLRMNISPRVLLPAAFADRGKLTAPVHRHYLNAFRRPAERMAPWVLARELIGSSAWYDELWNRRAALAGKPTLLLWGMKDPAFGPAALARWRAALPDARAVEFGAAGHFVQEEAPEAALRELRTFLAGLPRADSAGLTAAPPR